MGDIRFMIKFKYGLKKEILTEPIENRFEILDL